MCCIALSDDYKFSISIENLVDLSKMKIYDLQKFILKINELKSLCGYDLATNSRVGDVNIEKALKVFLSFSRIKLIAKYCPFSQCLKKISRQTNDEIYLTHVDVVNTKDLIYCCLILIKHSILKCKLDFSKKFSKQAAIKIQTSFCLLLFMFPNERTREIIDIALEFMDNENVWSCEAVSIEIFHCLLSSCECAEVIFHKILDRIEAESRTAEAQCCSRILYSIININFKELTSDALMRLINFYHASIEISETKSKLHPHRIAFKVALMRLFRIVRAEEISKSLPEILNLIIDRKCEFLLKEFGFTMQQGISELSANAILENLQPEVIDQLLLMMTSHCAIESSIACNFLTSLIDHYRNSKFFQVPIIFFLYTNYGHKKGNGSDQAIAIMKDSAMKIEDAVVRAVQLHGKNQENLLSIYKLLCVIIISLPTGIINIMVMKILLKLQRFAIEQKEAYNQDEMNAIHALIISIMTLICYVTRAKALSGYVHEIVRLRYDIAPQLNPNFKKKKGSDSDMNIKPELLLDKWELRYCLWKHYKFGDVLNASIYETK